MLQSLLNYGALLYESALFKKQFNIGALNLFHNYFKKFFFFEGKLNIGYGLFIYCIVAGAQKLSHDVCSAPYLGIAPVYIKLRVDGLHTCSH